MSMESEAVRTSRVKLLAAARPAAAPRLDQAQEDTIKAALQANALVVYGAPGTGKTTTLLALADRYLSEPGVKVDDLLVLAPTRVSAGTLATELSIRLGRTSSAPMVRTAASLAFSILRAEAVRLGEPSPILISGAEQDAILAELLAVHHGGTSNLAWPARIPEESLSLRGFRDELRDLLMRAAERGVTPDQLGELGTKWNRPEWHSAAQLYKEYQEINALRRSAADAPVRYDPAAIVSEATVALHAWDGLALPQGEARHDIPRPRWSMVLVDDYHEATAATATLLHTLHSDGAKVVFFADPDSSVQGFRGAVPALAARAESPRAVGSVTPEETDGFNADTAVLPKVWRHGSAIRAAISSVTDRIRSAGAVAHRRATAALAHNPGEVSVEVYTSFSAEVGGIARRLREAHLTAELPWNEMAVIVRSGAEVARLRQGLATAGVPVAATAPEVSVRDEPAVRPFLLALRYSVAPDELDAEAAVALLTSPIGGADAVALRRLRRALRVEEVTNDGTRASDELLIEALGDPNNTLMLDGEVRLPALRVAQALATGRACAASPGASATDVLWAIWEATGLAESWRRTALGAGAGSVRADQDLDAIVALFASAERFGERMPQATPGLFLAELLAQDLPEDTLAPRAPTEHCVQILTSATAAGRQWQLVVVAGVQDGSWPDLRIRDSALGAVSLVEVLSGRSTDSRSGGAEARRAVLDDELRMFAVATSRARSVLVVTAVANTDEQPSVFVDLLPWSQLENSGDGTDPVQEASARDAFDAPRPFDLRGLVAELRAVLVQSFAEAEQDEGIDHDAPNDMASQAAQVLAWLSEEGVPGADPQGWLGLLPESTSEPLWEPTQMVPVSPSKVEAFDRCGLRWMLESAGGTSADSTSQAVGTLVHEIAARFPTADLSTLQAELDRRWPTLGLGTAWPGLQQRKAAERIIERLAGYLGKSSPPTHVEESFSVDIGRARLRGQIDRVEPAAAATPEDSVDSAGTQDEKALTSDESRAHPVRIVDLKTGKSAISKAEAEQNPQLGAYQAAIDAGALGDDLVAAGAALVFVGVSGKSASVREQVALSAAGDPAWAANLVSSVAEGMSASAFVARANSLCPMCHVRSSCPLQAVGRQVNS